MNGGAFRPTKFTIPEGCLLDVKYPTPVGGISKWSAACSTSYSARSRRRSPAHAGRLVRHDRCDDRRRPPSAYRALLCLGVSVSGRIRRLSGRRRPGAWRDAADGELHVAQCPSIDYPARFRISGCAGFQAARENSAADAARAIVRAVGDCAFGARVIVSITCRSASRVESQPRRTDVRFAAATKRFVPPLRSKYEKQPLREGDLVMNASPGGGGFGESTEAHARIRRARSQPWLHLRARPPSSDYGAVIAETRPGRRTQALQLDSRPAKSAQPLQNQGSGE